MEKKTIVVALAAQKGGCGKTTVCITLASFLHYKLGKKTLVIDTDCPQYSYWTLRNDELKNLETNETQKNQLIKQEVALYPVIQLTLEELPSTLEKYRESGEYDVILIDTPGSVNIKGYKEGLKSCDFVFTPFEAESMSLNSNMEYIVYLIRDIINSPGSRIKDYGVFWNKVKKTTNKDLFIAVDTELRNNGINVLDVIVEDRVDYQRDVTRSTLFPIQNVLIKSQMGALINLINNLIFFN